MSDPLIVIQARLGSTRLPGKVVMRIGKKTMLNFVISRCPIRYNIRRLIPYEDLWFFEALAGADYASKVPADDVLARYFYGTVAGHHDPIVRITADCPLIDPAVIQRALDEYDGTALVCSTKGPDYTDGYPDGQDVEVFSREMLEQAFAVVHGAGSLFGRAVYAEHPTLWMRENLPTRYLDHTPPVQGLKLSVDTWDDLQFVRRIVRDLGPDCTLEEIYAWAAAQPERRPTVSG